MGVLLHFRRKFALASRMAIFFAVAMLSLVLCATAWAQAAAEYGMASGAAAAAATAATKSSSVLPEAGNANANKTEISPKTTEPPPATETNPVTRVAPKPLEAILKDNKDKVEAKAKEGGATLRVASVSVKATVYVDGMAVGYTPFESKLAAGNHLIEVKYVGAMPWVREVSPKEGDTLSLKPVLHFKQYPSTITLSRQH